MRRQSLNFDATDPPVWVPTPEVVARSRLGRFARRHGFDGRLGIDGWAARDPEGFWSAAIEDLGLQWHTQPTTILGEREQHVQRWFPDGRFNIADNAVDRWVRAGRGDERALVAGAEAGPRVELSFAELAAAVRRAAAGLRSLGVTAGDRVAVQLPMIVEAVVITLACARIGAVVVPLFSGFGPGAVLSRIHESRAGVHVVAAAAVRRGQPRDLLTVAREVHTRCLHPVRTVVVGETEGAAASGEIPWADMCTSPGADHAESIDAEHPLMVAYTSGTTGRPKGIVVSQAGFAAKAGTDAAWLFDLDVGDTACWVTDPGWVMFPITVIGGLLAGSAVGLLDGAVDYPHPRALWDFTAAAAISMLGVSPTLVRTLMAADAVPEALPACLRVIASSGEPWTPDAFHWLTGTVARRRLPLINYSGGTEVSGAILSNTVLDAVHPGGFAGGVPGMGADVVGPDGRPVRGAPGSLVLTCDSPGMTRGFDGDLQRYVRTYRSRWPGLWDHGDVALRTTSDDGTSAPWWLLGRSDDTLKIAGKRISPSEVEAVVVAHPGIRDAAAVGVPDPVKGEALVIFVCPVPGGDPARLSVDVRNRVAAAMGKALTPHDVHCITSLPRNRSGKVVRRLLRDICADRPLSDTSSLEDPGLLDQIRASLAARP